MPPGPAESGLETQSLPCPAPAGAAPQHRTRVSPPWEGQSGCRGREWMEHWARQRGAGETKRLPKRCLKEQELPEQPPTHRDTHLLPQLSRSRTLPRVQRRNRLHDTTFTQGISQGTGRIAQPAVRFSLAHRGHLAGRLSRAWRHRLHRGHSGQSGFAGLQIVAAKSSTAQFNSLGLAHRATLPARACKCGS